MAKKKQEDPGNLFGLPSATYTICMTQVVDTNSPFERERYYRFGKNCTWTPILAPHQPIARRDFCISSEYEKSLRDIAPDYVVRAKRKTTDFARVVPVTNTHDVLASYCPTFIRLVVHCRARPMLFSLDRLTGFFEDVTKETPCMFAISITGRPLLIPVKRLDADIKPSFFCAYLPQILERGFFCNLDESSIADFYNACGRAYATHVHTGCLAQPIELSDAFLSARLRRS